MERPWPQLKVHRIGSRDIDDEWIDGDEIGARLQVRDTQARIYDACGINRPF